MALRLTYETSGGLTCSEAYAIITNVWVEKKEVPDDGDDSNIHHDFFAHYNGEIFASQDLRTEGKPPVGGFASNFILSEGGSKNHYNIVKQAYLHLKDTDEKFANAEDC